jgi:hypothetical protein
MTMSMTKTTGAVLVLSAAMLMLVGVSACGGGGENGGDDADAWTGDPLSLSNTQIGAGVPHGMLGHLRDGTTTDKNNLDEVSSQIDHVFLHLQPYDEQSRIVGEWESYEPAANTTDYKRSTFFRNNPIEGRLAAPETQARGRAADLVSEFNSSFDENPPDMSMVVDFWRTRGDWFVRWDGNLDAQENLEGQGPYGFYHQPMVESLLDQLAHVAEQHQPRIMVIGSDMERLLATDGGEGIAPNEWSNFVRFYKLAAQRIADASNSTRVAVGINWDRFALQVTPRYVGSVDQGSVPSREAINQAIETFLAPLWRVSDAVALKSYRSAGLVEDNSYFAPLASLDDFASASGKPLVWYSVGAPAPQGNDNVQQDYLSSFLEWNKGIEPTVVSWRMLKDLHGSRDPIAGRCKTFVDSQNFPMERERCFDGLYNESTAPKAPMEYIQNQLGGQSN